MRKLLLALVAVVTVAAARPAQAKVRVVTSIETFADLARKVGGDRVDVQPLSHGYTDPHFVQAKPSLVIALNRADLLVHVGLELEIGWLPPLVLGARNEKIQPGGPGNLDISVGIPVLDVPAQRVDRSLGDIHPQGNPHYWVAPDNAAIAARESAERLSQIDSGGKVTYDANLAAFLAELQKRKLGWDQEIAGLRGIKVVTYHKSWSYVSKWLGLEEMGYVENKPGIPPSPSHIAQLIGEMRRDHVKIVMMESFYPRSTVDLVADKSSAKTVVLPSDVGASDQTKDYFALVDQVVKQLAAAAK